MSAGIRPFGDSALDCMVAGAHRLRIYGRPLHPYFLASDVGAFAGIVALAALLSTRAERPPFHLVRFLIAFAVMQLGYAGFLRAKAHFFGVRSRSFLQDSLLLAAALSVHVSPGRQLAGDVVDMAGLGLPLGLSCIRVGCFLSGCCYGRPFTRGVLYPASLLKPVTGWRSFTPGAVPSGRVFPIQLLESWVNALAFAVLLAWWWSSERASGLEPAIDLYAVPSPTVVAVRQHFPAKRAGLASSQAVDYATARGFPVVSSYPVDVLRVRRGGAVLPPVGDRVRLSLPS